MSLISDAAILKNLLKNYLKTIGDLIIVKDDVIIK